MLAKLPGIFALLLSCCLVGGCVSNAKADARARAAFLAGQQQAVQQLQLSGLTVTVVGEVKNSILPWTAELTLARAIVAAEYFGATDPSEVIIVRAGQEMNIDPRQLLNGEDIPLQPRDVVELRR